MESDGLLADEALIRSEWITGMIYRESVKVEDDKQDQVVQEVKIQDGQ